MEIFLCFAGSILEVYREKLRTFMNNILTQGITQNRPPYIEFPGMNHGKFEELRKLRSEYEYRYRA